MTRPNDKETAMTAVLKTVQSTAPAKRSELQRWYLALDGNQHRSDLQETAPADKAFLISEAMLPEIRTVACLIAAERRQDGRHSPAVFTEEADWFAARILVLGVRVFHLDVTLIPMLKTANARAERFARRFGLPFVPAQMRMSLHADRPHGGLIIENGHFADTDAGMCRNTQNLRHRLRRLLPDTF